jgi:hypothetical protein
MTTPDKMTSFRCALYFGIYGPLIGAAVLLLVVAPIAYGGGAKSSVSDYLWVIPMTIAYSIWIVPIALILGIVPGVVTGLMYVWLRSWGFVARLPALARIAMMSLLGGAACVLFGVCLGAPAADMVSKEILAMFVAPGIAAAAVCTSFTDLRLRRMVHE